MRWVLIVVGLEILLASTVLFFAPDIRHDPLALLPSAIAMAILAVVAGLMCVVFDKLRGFFGVSARRSWEPRGFEVVVPEERRDLRK